MVEGDFNSTRCRSILIVEDEELIRATLSLALEFEGYLVFTAANGKEGIELLPKVERPCLILLDLMMPVMNGWEFVDALEKDMILATIPVIVVTAFNNNTKTIHAKKILKKPI